MGAAPSCCGRSGRGARWQHIREYAALSDRDGGLRGPASSQPQDARLMPARYVRPYQRRFHYHLRSSGENTKARGYLGHELRVAARSGLWPLHWQDSKNFRSLPLRSRLTEIHQFPDGTIVETFHRHAVLELLDRDLAGEAVVGAVKADQPGDDPLEQRRPVGEDGLQDGRLALE